jgi:predicted DNA-binding transcriptional regulator YafY
MAEPGAGLTWGVERRLEFIEFRLFWEGGVNRSDIIEKFGVSVPQASKDLTLYQERAPLNVIYDKSRKRYVPSPDFSPRFLNPEPAEYLNQLRSVADGVLDRSSSWIGQFPAYDAAAAPVRGVSAGTLRSVIGAIRESEAIEVRYQSLSRPEPRWRWLSPHAIGFDGFRWHARAFCGTDQRFKDFLLSRFLETRGRRPSEVSAEADTDWREEIVLEIGPHPELSESQQKVIALDYGMRGGKARIPVRKALVYYTMKRLGLDAAPTVRRPQDQQIVLLNHAAVVEATGRGAAVY